MPIDFKLQQGLPCVFPNLPNLILIPKKCLRKTPFQHTVGGRKIMSTTLLLSSPPMYFQTFHRLCLDL